MQVINPVLPGFNPDPSILRVGNDYYIATSTFEWFPGVCIHHSTDLVNWEIADYALKDDKVLDMTGIDAACGVWAPNLTWSDGLFYLAYTVVYTNRSRYKDTFNYVVTAPSVHGPWSEPAALSKSGFDPSIFHDDDGRKYLVNMTIDHRADTIRFSGIDVQEYDPVARRLVGEPVRVFRGTKAGTTEGPNILKHGGWYYLTVAEGGTQVFHCTTVARSRNLFGPYEESPYNPVVTSEGGVDCKLRRAGHAQLVEAVDGSWYISHLCSRQIDKCSILGRETALQNIMWTEDGWYKLAANDQAVPEDACEVAADTVQVRDHSARVDFAACGQIPLDYMTLRRGPETWGIRVTDGQLHIKGGASPFCKYDQALLARRQQSFRCDFSTMMHFSPRHLNHIAGLMVYYNYDNHYWLKLLRDEQGLCLTVTSLVNQTVADYEAVHIPTGDVKLHAHIRNAALQFFYALPDGEEQAIGPVLDMRNISDERIEGNGFTGSMLGVNCCDCQGDGCEAVFDYLDYAEAPDR